MSRASEEIRIRRVIVNSWNNPYATGTVNGNKRIIGEFKAVNNIGDFLSRQNYRCGSIPNPIQPNSFSWRSRIGSIIQNCDKSGIPSSNTNTKFVPDSSEYTKYKKIRAFNKNFNDSKTTTHNFVINRIL
jgi:hypothetical protein